MVFPVFWPFFRPGAPRCPAPRDLRGQRAGGRGVPAAAGAGGDPGAKALRRAAVGARAGGEAGGLGGWKQ